MDSGWGLVGFVLHWVTVLYQINELFENLELCLKVCLIPDLRYSSLKLELDASHSHCYDFPKWAGTSKLLMIHFLASHGTATTATGPPTAPALTFMASFLQDQDPKHVNTLDSYMNYYCLEQEETAVTMRTFC